MAEQTKITWCDSTFNPWVGCSKVSAGCANCYAETLMDKRYGKVKWGKGNPRQRTSAANWRLPLRWNREAGLQQSCGDCDPCVGGRPDQCVITPISRPRVFCASLADWLDDEVPTEWLADLLNLIHETPNLDWLLLTKRPENFVQRVLMAGMHMMGYRDGQSGTTPSQKPCASEAIIESVLGWSKRETCPQNVWLGVSTENQEMADKRIPHLLKIPAKVRFLSVEPMLGPIDFRRIQLKDEDAEISFNCLDGTGVVENSDSPSALIDDQPHVDWAIFGGESGSDARPCSIEWIRDGLAQCKAASVAAFVKQLGADAYSDTTCFCGLNTDKHWKGPAACFACAGRLNLKDKKGGEMAEWPEDLRVREFPTV